MKEMLRFGFILGIICVIAGGLLAGVYALTQPKIIAQASAEEESSLKTAFPLAQRFEEVKEKGETAYYKAFDKENKFLGTAFKASGKGYSGEIKVLVGMLEDGKITGIKILSQNETPGLGSRIADPDFTDRFKGRGNLAGVEAITGATVSSRAVIDSVKKKAEEIKAKMKNER